MFKFSLYTMCYQESRRLFQFRQSITMHLRVKTVLTTVTASFSSVFYGVSHVLHFLNVVLAVNHDKQVGEWICVYSPCASFFLNVVLAFNYDK